MYTLRIFAHVVTLAVQREAAFRVNMLFEGLLTLVGVLSGLAALGIVFAHTGTLAGWSFGETVVLLGAYEIVSGLLQAFVEPNLSWFGGKVTRGELDDLLLQPAPALFMASFGTCNPWALAQVTLGVAVAAAGLASIGATLSLAGVSCAVFLLLVGIVVTWASRMLLACLAFWAPGIALDVMYSAFWQLGRYPVGIYHPALRALLTYIVPVAFVATLPARALTRPVDATLIVEGLLVAAGALLLVRLVWQAGLRRYTSATS